MQKNIRLLISIAILVITPLMASLAAAHGMWFAQRAGELALVYGHGAEDLSVIKRLGLLTSLSGVDATGKIVAVVLKPTDYLAFINLDNTPVIITATLDNGFWSQQSDGKWINKGRDEVLGAKHSGHYLKYSTHLRELPKGEVKPLTGLAFQIVPVSKVFPKHIGDQLELRILLDGRPAVGAQVWVDYVNDPDAKPLVVNHDGNITIKLRNQGLNVIKAEVDSPPLDADKADKTQHTATLSFVLPNLPE